ncbi:MAG: serine hydrolase [Bacteroidetes bacterium]|nr:MAG: serine hydrolase [Bacteroidota bacterium]
MKVIAFLFLIIPCLLFAESDSREIRTEFLDIQMEQLMEEQQLPHAVISVVSNGEIIFRKGYGFSDLESGAAVNPETTILRTGSVAKIFTWTSAMQLFEKGLLDLDADINLYLDFEIPSGLKGHGSEQMPEPITMRHLMTHSAGFEDVLDGLFSFQPQPTLRDYLIRHMPARIFPTGEVMAYSNYGTALAGYIVERLSGLPFEDYVEQNIFKPLHMHKSTFRQPLPSEMRANAVTAYRKVDGEFLPARFEHMPAPAGGLSTTAGDMALYMIALLHGGSNIFGTLMQSQTLETMYTLQKTYHPILGGMTSGFKQFNVNGNEVIFHGGSSTVFDSGLYLLPEENFGIFIAYSGGDYTGHIRIFHDFLSEFFGGKDYDIRDMLEVSPEATPALSDLRGEYHQSRMMITSSDRILNLMMGVMHVDIDDDGYLVVKHLGHEHRFRELKPGIYENLQPKPVYPFGPFKYLVAETAPDGRLMLTTDGPLTYIKMPFHATSAFARLLFLPALLLAIFTLLFFFLRFIFRKPTRRNKKLKSEASLARSVLKVHALLLVAMVVLLVITGRPHPVYLLPESAFGETGFTTILLTFLPWFITILFVALLYFAFVQWRKKWWKIGAKIHYTFYSLFAVGLVWLFYFYNLIKF